MIGLSITHACLVSVCAHTVMRRGEGYPVQFVGGQLWVATTAKCFSHMCGERRRDLSVVGLMLTSSAEEKHKDAHSVGSE